MRIFSDCVEAAKEVERDLVEMGVDNHPGTMQDINVRGDPKFMTKEILGYSYRINNPVTTILDWVDHFKLNSDWLKAEFNERMDHRALNPGNAWKLRGDTWSPFLHWGMFAYTYSERMSYQLKDVIDLLKSNPGTRQAVITVYEGKQDVRFLGGKSRVPCSMYYHFLRRRVGGASYVNLIYSMRSCDYYLHYAYDVALAILLMKHVSDRTDCWPGFFQHQIGSLHAYARDYESKGIF